MLDDHRSGQGSDSDPYEIETDVGPDGPMPETDHSGEPDDSDGGSTDDARQQLGGHD
jgi:hypothetical protein